MASVDGLDDADKGEFADRRRDRRRDRLKRQHDVVSIREA